MLLAGRSVRRFYRTGRVAPKMMFRISHNTATVSILYMAFRGSGKITFLHKSDSILKKAILSGYRNFFALAEYRFPNPPKFPVCP